MIHRIRKAMNERDQGFTLIELLVVIIIIGILAAIAIPVFLNQRKKGVDASLKTDLKNAATAAETISADAPTIYFWFANGSGANPLVRNQTKMKFTNAGFKASPDNVVAVNGGPMSGYQICAYNPGATSATDATKALMYDSNAGGIVPTPVDCTPGATWLLIT